LEDKWRFGGTCRLHLQGRRISQARNQRETCSKQSLKSYKFFISYKYFNRSPFIQVSLSLKQACFLKSGR
jgi:hypothetical protein